MEEIKVTSMIRFCTISLLQRGPKHGYELIKTLKTYFGREISPAHIYPFLSLLEKNKLISCKKIGAREKKQYFMTQKGKKFTKNLLNKFDEMTIALIESKIKKCAHCNCEIYKNGYEKAIKGKKLIFCCQHCAKH